MDKKKLILLIVAGVFALILLTVLIVGISDGIWPWDGPKAYAKVFKEAFTAPAATQPATEPSEEPTEAPEDETTEPSGQEDPSQPTTNNPVIDGESPTGGKVDEEVIVGGDTGSGNNSGENSGDNTGDGGNTGSGDDMSDADATTPGNKIPGWGN